MPCNNLDPTANASLTRNLGAKTHDPSPIHDNAAERPQRQRRDPSGKFLTLAPGEVGAATTLGLYARRDQLPDDAIADRVYAEQWRDRLVSDQGGDDLAAMRGELIDTAADLVFLKRRLIADVKVRGIHTKKHRTRASVPTLLQVVDRLERLSRALGLDRHQRSMESHGDWLQRLADEGDIE